MIFYLIVGVITSLLAYVSIKNYDKNKLVFCWTFILFIIFPSVIEGCRNWNIGMDMQGYGSVFFYDAQRYSNVKSFVLNLETKEYAYHLLCYFCGKVGTINLYMFAAALIKMTMLALTCLHFRKITIPWMIVFGYMLFFYWYGFSLMRQSLALSICMYSLTFLYDRKYIPFILCIIIGYLFHNSSIFMLFMPFVMYMEKVKHRMIIVTLGVGIIYALATVLFVFVATSGLFGDNKADLYLDSGVTSAKTNIIIMIAFYLFTYFCKKTNRNLGYYIQACSLIGLMFLFLSSLFEVAFRMSFYQMIPLLLLIPSLVKNTRNELRKKIVTITYVCLFLLHLIVSANHGMADTIPYKSVILDHIL